MKIEAIIHEWIEANFVTEALKIEDFELFPHGKRLIDAHGDEMVVYFDYLKECVQYCFPDGQ